MKKLLTLLMIFSLQAHAYYGMTGYVPDPLRRIRAQKRDYTHGGGLKSATPLPAEYDLRHIGNGTAPIRNQGGCGSCWWFGTKGTMESLVKLRDNKDIEISGQEGIDCEPDAFSGCGGGDRAFHKFLAPLGAIYESEYPFKYEASNDSCQKSWLPGHFHETIIDYADVDIAVEAMQRAMFENEAPLEVTVGAGGMSPGNDGWQDDCYSAGTNHIVYIVGWLEGSLHGHKAGPHWIEQNSWGTGWGDHGYEYILARGDNGTVCASLGSEEITLVNYKPACNPQPKADAGPDVNIVMAPKLPHDAQIGTESLKDMTYSWSPSTGLSDASAAEPWASPSKTTIYTLTVKSPCGVASTQVKVHVFNEVK